MAGYGGYSRARKSSARSSIRSRSSFRRSGVYLKKKRTGIRFALAGFRRGVEKKYWDKTYQANNYETLTGNVSGLTDSNGVTYISNDWGKYDFTGKILPTSSNNSMLRGVQTGTTALTRIGNKIKVNYVKGAFTFTAAQVDDDVSSSQGGQIAVGETDTGVRQYLRTTFRFVIVKDLQVNGTDENVKWEQVFNLQGVHRELNINNMGRFIVLEDRVFTVDADTPQNSYFPQSLLI